MRNRYDTRSRGERLKGAVESVLTLIVIVVIIVGVIWGGIFGINSWVRHADKRACTQWSVMTHRPVKWEQTSDYNFGCFTPDVEGYWVKNNNPSNYLPAVTKLKVTK